MSIARRAIRAQLERQRPIGAVYRRRNRTRSKAERLHVELDHHGSRLAVHRERMRVADDRAASPEALSSKHPLTSGPAIVV